MRNKEAHEALYRTFMERSHEFDLMIKVDADMVIENRDLFAGIVAKFAQTHGLELLTIAVYDFFSDRQIDGMNAFRNTVRWPKNDEMVFVDRHSVPREHALYDDHELAPAAIHCKNPSPFQAFHFGIHKGVKLLAAKQRGLPGPLHNHWDNVERTWEHFLRARDVRLGFASLGAALALRGRFAPQHLDYRNPYAAEVFRQYEHCSPEDLRTVVLKLSSPSRRLFAPEARLEISRDGWGMFLLRRAIPRAMRSWLPESLMRWIKRRLMRFFGYKW